LLKLSSGLDSNLGPADRGRGFDVGSASHIPQTHNIYVYKLIHEGCLTVHLPHEIK